MKEELILRIRKRTSVKGKQKTWISELNDEQLFSLFMMVKRGQTAKSIAAHIQKKWGIREKSTIHSLSQGILKFKQRVLDLSISSQTHGQTDSIKVKTSVYRPTDNLEKNEEIANALRKRIDRMMQEEQDLSISYPNLSRDLLALVALEKAILKQKEYLIKFQNEDPLEYSKKQDEATDINGMFKKIIQQLFPDEKSEKKFLESTDRYLELIEENAISMVQDEGGNWGYDNRKLTRKKG